MYMNLKQHLIPVRRGYDKKAMKIKKVGKRETVYYIPNTKSLTELGNMSCAQNWVNQNPLRRIAAVSRTNLMAPSNDGKPNRRMETNYFIFKNRIPSRIASVKSFLKEKED